MEWEEGEGGRREREDEREDRGKEEVEEGVDGWGTRVLHAGTSGVGRRGRRRWR